MASAVKRDHICCERWGASVVSSDQAGAKTTEITWLIENHSKKIKQGHLNIEIKFGDVDIPVRSSTT